MPHPRRASGSRILAAVVLAGGAVAALGGSGALQRASCSTSRGSRGRETLLHRAVALGHARLARIRWHARRARRRARVRRRRPRPLRGQFSRRPRLRRSQECGGCGARRCAPGRDLVARRVIGQSGRLARVGIDARGDRLYCRKHRGPQVLVGEATPERDHGSRRVVCFRRLVSIDAYAASRSLSARCLPNRASDRYRWLRRALGYGVAGATAYARLNHNAHWASDVAAGAALGFSTARFTMHRREGGAEDTTSFNVTPTAGGGLMLAFTMPLH